MAVHDEGQKALMVQRPSPKKHGKIRTVVEGKKRNPNA